ncbi:FAD-binding monooxygenase [Fimicolochytrium jonesii]|uniref:FAD-binding monooxygenase n=1 Tax=Fimicolochytrium jonesii TaxID=1396493 RepID=UPI0022FE36FB|nr:FAD-binding monooxygenase [Fimicolochytrium jonesii]KAI8816325.1 FAD-binding monooxygenase [Fimicolochytrium jonesii]
MRVIIIGGGIGGLTTAIALSRALPDSTKIDVYERVPVLLPIGAAISVWSNGVKVLKHLGLGDAIEAAAGDMQRMAYKTKDGKDLCDFSLQPLYEKVGQRACPIARTHLQRILLEGATQSCTNVTVHLDKAAASFTQSATSVTITFSDGASETAHLLIIAEGTHSKLRNTVIGRPVQRSYVGYVNYNGAVPITPALSDSPTTWTQYVGDGKRVSMMPMGDGHKFYFFFDVSMPAGSVASHPDTYKNELAAYFAGWADPVQNLIKTLDPAKVARVEIHDIEELTTFVNGRVALLGDAAHGTAPDLGQGGCQAMEDAWVLAQALKNHPGDHSAAYAEYDKLRVERTVQLVSRARKRAEMIHGKDMAVTMAWYEELARESGEGIMDGMSKTILGAPAGLDSAVEPLKKEGLM